jgi:hypothetical protein
MRRDFRMIRYATVFGLCFAAIPAVAQEISPPSFYDGVYRMIGVTPAGPLDQKLRLTPAEDGNLKVSLCDTPDGGGLKPPAAAAEDPFLDGRIGAESVSCEPFHNWDNYPVIICYGDSGSRMTLWPEGDFSAALTCDK